MKLDIACGQHRQEGFHGVDIVESLYDDDYTVHDLAAFPWPFEDESVKEAFCSHYVEHTPDLVGFMNEVYRVLEPEAKIRIVHPYVKSNRAFQDPTHTRFIPEETWYYFNAEWRSTQGLDHYPIKSDFNIDLITATYLPPWDQKHHEAQQFALRHYWNVAADLIVDLSKKAA